MKEIVGDIWDFHDAGHWVVITTNGTITYNDLEQPCCVMGAGVAKQARERFTSLPATLGQLIVKTGNTVYMLPQYRIYTLPVKEQWWMAADMYLIKKSCEQLAEMVPWDRAVYMVRPGCGVGRLAWRNVKPEIERLLDDRFVVVELPQWKPFT